jgi:predicted Zn-dependent peptidase
MSVSKKIKCFPILLVLILPAALSAQTIHIPPHERVIFKNGLTVLLLEKRGVPIINFAAIVKTGSAADPQGQEGLASITAQLLRKARKNAPPSNSPLIPISPAAQWKPMPARTFPAFRANF